MSDAQLQERNIVERIDAEIVTCTGEGWFHTAKFLSEIKAEITRLRAQPSPREVALKTALELARVRTLEPGDTPTEKMREHARASELYKAGDMVLVWINEGDLCNNTIAMRALSPGQKEAPK